ncbi:hypothetical protein I311_06764 [Cryptococcus gattii NT-10]|nr:hypothetical protein I311_06764 [Cryptococcus gattii NT-10]
MTLKSPANGQIIAAIIEILDKVPHPHPVFNAPAFSFNHLAYNLHVSPPKLSLDHTINLVRPLAETLFDRPREPVVKNLRKGLGREVWVVFETVSSYPEKWKAEHGEKKKELAQFMNEASSIGRTFSLPRPPAGRRDKGCSLEPSAFYLPDVNLASGELEAANFITNFPGGHQYTPSVTLPKRGKDDGPEESVFPSFSLDNNEQRDPNSAEISFAPNLSTGRLQAPYKEITQFKLNDKSKDVNGQRGETIVKTNQSFLDYPSGLRIIRDSNCSKDEEEEDQYNPYEANYSGKSDKRRDFITDNRVNRTNGRQEGSEGKVFGLQQRKGKEDFLRGRRSSALLMTVEQGESEEEKEKGYVGCGRESFVVKNKNGEGGEKSDGEEEDAEKIVRGREPNDGSNESEDQEMKGGAQADHSSDGNGGRNTEEEPISAASSGSKMNDQLTQDEAADGDENQRESKIQGEIGEKEKEKQVVEGKTDVGEWTQTNRYKHGREKDHSVAAKERSGKGRKLEERHKDKHKQRRRSSFSSLPSPKKEKKKRQNKKDGLESPFTPWFQVAFEGLPFGPDVPGVSPNSTYCY